MPAITYEYNKYDFERHFSDALSLEEYNAAKKNFYNFYHEVIDSAEEKFRKMKNPHAFKWKRFFILLGCGVALEGTDQILKAMDYYDAGEIFAMLSFFPFFAMFLQPFQWLLSKSKSSTFSNYENHARDYYLFQYSELKNAQSYPDYTNKVASATMVEFLKFDWEDEAAVISQHESPVEN